MKHFDTKDAATSATFDFAQPARAADIDSEIAVVPRFDEDDLDVCLRPAARALVMIDASGVDQKANGRGRELASIEGTRVPQHIGLEERGAGIAIPSQIKKPSWTKCVL